MVYPERNWEGRAFQTKEAEAETMMISKHELK